MFFLEFGVRLVFWVSKLWVSDSSKAVSVVSKDLQEVLQSNFDELPSSLKHLSKIVISEEFTNSVIRVSQALTDGILRGYAIENKSEIEEVGGLNFVDKVMDRMMGTVGTGFDQQKFHFFYIHVKKPIETQIVVQEFLKSREELSWENFFDSSKVHPPFIEPTRLVFKSTNLLGISGESCGNSIRAEYLFWSGDCISALSVGLWGTVGRNGFANAEGGSNGRTILDCSCLLLMGTFPRFFGLMAL
ncbi:hypothetical protein CQW23_22075 [Capsicum baccatum]|uniref:Uncharacterized protein n=1 Tax=Capsicum baccatum TaxID=33114 RepID=A0A2G2VZU4_CAPBA|nr:hypothetical protein CQW23_22075 [Capsicum baccatum]